MPWCTNTLYVQYQKQRNNSSNLKRATFYAVFWVWIVAFGTAEKRKLCAEAGSFSYLQYWLVLGVAASRKLEKGNECFRGTSMQKIVLLHWEDFWLP
jgi:hypothetical protein